MMYHKLATTSLQFKENQTVYRKLGCSHFVNQAKREWLTRHTIANGSALATAKHCDHLRQSFNEMGVASASLIADSKALI